MKWKLNCFLRCCSNGKLMAFASIYPARALLSVKVINKHRDSERRSCCSLAALSRATLDNFKGLDWLSTVHFSLSRFRVQEQSGERREKTFYAPRLLRQLSAIKSSSQISDSLLVRFGFSSIKSDDHSGAFLLPLFLFSSGSCFSAFRRVYKPEEWRKEINRKVVTGERRWIEKIPFRFCSFFIRN